MLLTASLLAFVLLFQSTEGCIPTFTDPDPPVTTTPAPEPTTPVDPCAGCVPPTVISTGYPVECTPDEPGAVTVELVRDGEKCILEPKGCPVGFLYALGTACRFTEMPGPLPSIECINGNFFSTVEPKDQVMYLVNGCSTFIVG